MKEIAENDTIALHYKGTLNNGELFDSSEGRDPLQFEVGTGQVIPGFDKAVIGHSDHTNDIFSSIAATCSFLPS